MTKNDEVEPLQEIAYEKELVRLRRLYKECLSTEDYEKNDRLVEHSAWLASQIRHLQNNISEDGTTIRYQNGENQWGTKTNPDVDTLNRFMSQYRDTKSSLDKAAGKTVIDKHNPIDELMKK